MSLEESLREQLEKARQELNGMQTQYGLCHPLVLHQSMVLDDLINEYHRKCLRPASGRSQQVSRAQRGALAGHAQILYRPGIIQYG